MAFLEYNYKEEKASSFCFSNKSLNLHVHIMPYFIYTHVFCQWPAMQLSMAVFGSSPPSNHIQASP